MPDEIELKLTPDEAALIVDALEADLDGYRESAEEARRDGNPQDAKTFTDAAERIKALLSTLHELLPGQAAP